MNGLFFLLGLAVLVLAGLVVIYNRLVQRRQLVRNGWADIDVQLKRRANLVPQLVSAVKGYAAHEQTLFEDIAEKRSQALVAGDDPAVRADAETSLSPAVARLVAVAEDYPDLKASDSFLGLQNELADTEEKIEMARRFYNGAVRELNIAIQSFPNSLVVGPFGFVEAVYFEISLNDRGAPTVDLEPE